ILRQFGLAFGALMFGVGPIELGLIRTPINGEQQVALLHFLALLEGNLVEVAAHACADLDGLGRFKPASVFVPLNNLTLDRTDDRNGGRRWTRRLTLVSATGEQRANRKREEYEKTARFHGFNPWLASGPRRTTAICPHHAKLP